MALRAPDLRLAPLATAAAPSLPARIVLYWRWVCLSVLLVLAAALESLGLGQEGYANTYYAAGVKSMLTSWHNFFFVSFDAGGFVSLDKPPLGFWIQAASAKLFGFSGVSLLLPEVVAGVLSVALLYHLVARAHGAVAGLLAALLLAVTPISAIIDRNNTIDSLLIFTLLLGVWAVSLATERGHLRWLLLAALLVGLGFNIKMLQAYLVVPGFALLYLLGARLPLRTRLLHLLLAGVVLLVVSFCWVVAVDVTPASLRPFVSDSGTNSELSLVFGYNGLGRLTQALFPGLTHISIFGDPIDLTIEPGFSAGIGNPGLFRLLSSAHRRPGKLVLAAGPGRPSGAPALGTPSAGWRSRRPVGAALGDVAADRRYLLQHRPFLPLLLSGDDRAAHRRAGRHRADHPVAGLPAIAGAWTAGRLAWLAAPCDPARHRHSCRRSFSMATRTGASGWRC